MTKRDYALEFAKNKHFGQTRKDGVTPYITHCIGVADLVYTYATYEKLDVLDNMIIASYLHDTLEDTDTSYDELNDSFGEEVAYLVWELTSDKAQSKRMGKANYLKDKMTKMSESALTIKLADRLHNQRDVKALSVQKIQQFIEQNEEIIEYLFTHRELNETQKDLIRALQVELSTARDNLGL